MLPPCDRSAAGAFPHSHLSLQELLGKRSTSIRRGTTSSVPPSEISERNLYNANEFQRMLLLLQRRPLSRTSTCMCGPFISRAWVVCLCFEGRLSDVSAVVWTPKLRIIKIKRKSERFYLHNGIEMCHHGTRCICSSQIPFIKNQKTSGKLLCWRADRCARQRHEREYFGGHYSCCPSPGRGRGTQPFIVWTWKEIIRHTDIWFRKAAWLTCHVWQKEKGSWILWSAVCHRPALLFSQVCSTFKGTGSRLEKLERMAPSSPLLLCWSLKWKQRKGFSDEVQI